MAASIAAIFFFLALFKRDAHSKLVRILENAGTAFSGIISDVMLFIVFSLIFIPARGYIIFSGKDTLRLKKEPHLRSYWISRKYDDAKHRFANLPFYLEDSDERAGSSMLRKGVIVLLFLCFLGGLGELVLRYYGYGHPVLYVSHPTIGYFMAPNQELTRQGGSRISINEFGMRSGKIAKEKPASVKRVMILGDSVSFGGSYVDQDDIYPSLLQRFLQRKAAAAGKGSLKIEVLNLSTNGWGPLHQLAYLKEFGTFGADLAIMVLPIYNLYRPLYHLPSVPFFDKNKPPHYAASEVLGHLLWRSRATQLGSPYFDYPDLMADQSMEACLSIAKLFESQGGKVIMIETPYYDEVRDGKLFQHEKLPFEARYDRMSALFSSGGREIYFSQNYFIAKSGRKELSRYFHDSLMHFSKGGHQLFEEYLETLPVWDRLL